MNLRLLCVLIALFLTACGTTIAKDDAPASDLDAYVLSVKRGSQPVMLDNGKDYCMELSDTEDAQDDCGGDLEDALYTANKKLLQLYKDAVKFTDRLRLARNPCGFLARTFRVDRCRIKNSATP